MSQDSSVHCSGSVHAAAAKSNGPRPDHHAALLRVSSGRNAADAGALYSTFHACGLEYGPSFRPLALLFSSADGCTQAGLRLAASGSAERIRAFVSALDGALQLTAYAADVGRTREPSLPFSVDRARLHSLDSWQQCHPLWASTAPELGSSASASVHISLSTLAGHANTALDGFKARALKTSLSAGKPQLRRWLYELEWSPTTSQMPPSVDVQASDIGMSRVLAVGPALQPAGRAASNDASLVLARSDVEAEAQLTGRKWHAVVLATIGTQAASFTELRLLDVCLSLAQGIVAMGKATPPLWAYTHGTIATRPLASSQGSADAGVWGLSRACRQELPALPIWCIDVGVDSAWQTGSAILDAGKKQGRELSLPDGNVHGLQLSATAEPEAAIRGGGRLYVPRLVMPYEIDAARHLVLPFASIRDGLSMHVADATSALDMTALAHGYAQLETLCQQYVRAAVAELEASSSSDVPVWHHKLVYEWCARQTAAEGTAPLVPSDVTAAHPRLWAEVQLAERCGPRLADALSSRVRYQELLFPGGSLKAVLPVYESAVAASFYNACVVAAVDVALGLIAQSEQQHYRRENASVVALEVGAGTGGTASSVLPVLETSCEQYIFTDVSEVRPHHLRKPARTPAPAVCTCSWLVLTRLYIFACNPLPRAPHPPSSHTSPSSSLSLPRRSSSGPHAPASARTPSSSTRC